MAYSLWDDPLYQLQRTIAARGTAARLRAGTSFGKGPRAVQQYPHCDQRILHAPGECQYCDAHPDWQELRASWHIAFSGHAPEHGEMACPADLAVLFGERGDYNRWGGNQPSPELSCRHGHYCPDPG